jgi:hypothetical protein
VEPIDANDWLKSAEKKFQVVQCNNREEVLLASHQLSRPAVNCGMLTWKLMRILRASTSRNLELLSVHTMFPKE